MKYRAIITDIDGTLIPNSRDGMPSKKVIHTIEKIKGIIPIGSATARSVSVMNHIFDVVPFTAPCIITGGAQIIDPVSRKILAETLLGIPELQEVVEIGKKYAIHFSVADAGYDHELAITSAYKPIRPLDMYSQLIEIEKAQEFIAAIAHISTVEAHKALGWEERKKVHVTITHPQASKQHGVLQVADMLHISPQEIIGIGEGYNDFSFLMSCGLKVAMGNAIDDLKKIADYVAPSIEEDGVADVIEKFVLC